MDSSDDDRSGSRGKKQALLNKFLSKTYHMVDQCDPSIATWSSDGASFVIKDVDEFAKTILPRYFKHSKFASFVRQLNFYSFRKLRSDRDVRLSSKSVRFAHEYFRQGHPDLLHKIQRITKSQEASSVEIRSIRDDIAKINENIDMLTSRFDNRLQNMTNEAESDYQERLAKISLAYQALSEMNSTLSSPTSSPSSPPATVPTTRALSTSSPQPLPYASPSFVKNDLNAPSSPRSSMSPLETLSGVASAMLSNYIIEEKGTFYG